MHPRAWKFPHFGGQIERPGERGPQQARVRPEQRRCRNEGARHKAERWRRLPRSGHRVAAVQRSGPDIRRGAVERAKLRQGEGRGARLAVRPAAGRRQPQTDHHLQPERGVREQDGESEQRRRPMVPDLPRELARAQERRAQVRRLDEAAVRVLGRLVPDRARLAPPVLRVQQAAHRGKFLPDGGRRIRVRRLPGSVVPPPQEAHLDEESGGDSRRRPAQVLQPSGQDVQTLATRVHKDPRAIHVLEILHRLPRHRPATRQTRELPVEPLRRPRGGDPQVSVPDVTPQRSGRIHRVPDGPRETADPRLDRKSCLPGVVPGAAATIDQPSASPARTTRHLRIRQRLLLRAGDTRVLHVHLQLVDGVLVVMRHRRQRRHRRH